MFLMVVLGHDGQKEVDDRLELGERSWLLRSEYINAAVSHSGDRGAFRVS